MEIRGSGGYESLDRRPMGLQMPAQNALNFRFLGEIEMRRGRRSLPLPQSKKTRALLAYLVLSRKAHRRARLSSLLWDVTDDPRGALRWSLSKLRALVDEPGRTRLVADRLTVRLDPAGANVDVFTVAEKLAGGTDALSTERLLELAEGFRGELLEGLELDGFLEFQAWCATQREDARQLRVQVLRALIARCAERPADALVHARTLVQVDPLDEEARAALVRLLQATGRQREADEQYHAARRVLEELGHPLGGELERTWSGGRAGAPKRDATPAVDADEAVALAGEESRPAPLVGRQAELGRLRAALDEVVRTRRGRVVLLSGEPGVGKSRLLSELMRLTRQRQGTVLDGCAYEVESGRPYGPWVDALRRLSALVVGPALAPDLAPLLPELAPDSPDPSSRDRLFGGVVELLAARAHSAPPVLIVLDDVQWCDPTSAALLHYVARMNRNRPLLLALAARAGELPDNASVCRALRALRRESLLTEIRLGPLGRAETEELVRAVAPEADAERVFAECGGNPLFAIEAARAPARRDGVSPTLGELVRERLERLPHEAAHVLRWGAVLGPTFSVERLRELAALDCDALVGGLETLERHALLHPTDSARDGGSAYVFAHDVVRGVVYGDLSAPRRQLMHNRIASLLAASVASEEMAPEIALHAAKAGDGATAARACVAAGRRCLRLFADGEADAFARSGMHHAEGLREPERVRLLLELQQIAVAARRPERIDETARQIEQLAEQAAAHDCREHARLGFHLVSWLRWERGEWSDAQRFILEAEKVGRGGDDRERVVALAEAARCLALLERDLGHAEALLLEAGATAKRIGVEPLAISDGLGMLRLHQGKFDDARAHFEHAEELARRDGDHAGEFQALAHLVTLEIERERWGDAEARAAALVEIAAKLRGGSEGPFARALAALCLHARADDGAGVRLDESLEALRLADAKHRLAYVLTRAAAVDLRQGDVLRGRERAAEALRAAAVLESTSELAMAHALLARAEVALADDAAAAPHRNALAAIDLAALSAHARAEVAPLLGAAAENVPPKKKTRRTAWKTSSSREPSLSR